MSVHLRTGCVHEQPTVTPQYLKQILRPSEINTNKEKERPNHNNLLPNSNTAISIPFNYVLIFPVWNVI